MSWGNIEDFNGFEKEESQCTPWQMSIIESLLVVANLDQKEKDMIGTNIEGYSEEEASKVIEYLNENKVENNPRKIWENMNKRHQ